jgi:hypothetical protein
MSAFVAHKKAKRTAQRRTIRTEKRRARPMLHKLLGETRLYVSVLGAFGAVQLIGNAQRN